MPTSQIAMEEIELLPHPLDAWRGALEALIACAPGSAIDVAWHLADAAGKLQRSPEELAVGHSEARLINHLMLLSAGRQAGVELEARRNEYGFTRAAPVIGEPGALPPVGQPTSSAFGAPRHQPSHQPSSPAVARDPAADDRQAPLSQESQPSTARPAPVRSPEHPAPQFDRS